MATVLITALVIRPGPPSRWCFRPIDTTSGLRESYGNPWNGASSWEPEERSREASGVLREFSFMDPPYRGPLQDSLMSSMPDKKIHMAISILGVHFSGVLTMRAFVLFPLGLY